MGSGIKLSINDDPKQRVLGIDLGQKRVGVSISDPFGNFAIGLETLNRFVLPKKQKNKAGQNTQNKAKKRPKEIEVDITPALQALCTQYKVGLIILGLPMNMDGSEGIKAQESREFGTELSQRLDLPVKWVDERLTSVIAHQLLQAQGISEKKSRKQGLVDETAAKLILQGYLDRQNASI